MTRARLFIPALAFVTFSGATPMAQHWPHWRGPTHDGVSLETNLPVSWGAECKPGSQAAEPAPTSGSSDQGAGPQPQGRGRGRGQPAEGRPLVSIACKDFDTKNVAWKLPLPAYSGSTPIIWGNTIFLNVATATNTGSIELWAIDRNKPEVKWKRLLVDDNNMQRKQNMSSPSPVTDGKHVWVMTGFGVFKAFDFDGKEIWSRDLQADYGKFGLNHGYASSPLLRPDGLYVQVLHGMKTDDPSYVLKIDRMTGKTVWRVERPTPAVSESPDSYTTPAWVEANGRAELIITGGDVVSGHDPATGKEYWRADVLNPTRGSAYRIIASPTIVDGLIIAPTRNNPLTAMRPGGSGDVAATHVVWTFAQGPDVPTPGQRRQAPLRRSGRRCRLRARRQDGPNRVWPGAPAGRHLHRVADPRRRQDLRHDGRRGADDGVPRGAEVRGPLVERTARRLLAVLPEHRGHLRRSALHPHVVVPLGDRGAEGKEIDPIQVTPANLTGFNPVTGPRARELGVAHDHKRDHQTRAPLRPHL